MASQLLTLYDDTTMGDDDIKWNGASGNQCQWGWKERKHELMKYRWNSGINDRKQTSNDFPDYCVCGVQQ